MLDCQSQIYHRSGYCCPNHIGNYVLSVNDLSSFWWLKVLMTLNSAWPDLNFQVVIQMTYFLSSPSGLLHNSSPPLFIQSWTSPLTPKFRESSCTPSIHLLRELPLARFLSKRFSRTFIAIRLSFKRAARTAQRSCADLNAPTRQLCLPKNIGKELNPITWRARAPSPIKVDTIYVENLFSLFVLILHLSCSFIGPKIDVITTRSKQLSIDSCLCGKDNVS